MILRSTAFEAAASASSATSACQITSRYYSILPAICKIPLGTGVKGFASRRILSQYALRQSLTCQDTNAIQTLVVGSFRNLHETPARQTVSIEIA